MSPVLSRQALLIEIAAEHTTLAALIDRVPTAGWTTSHVNSAGWSLKDVLAHAADWAQRSESWVEEGRKGKAVHAPAAGRSWKETPTLNHEIFLARKDHTLLRVRKEYEAGHAALVGLPKSLPDADLLEPKRFAWTGPTWSIAQYLRANTAEHDRWAAKHFRAWWRCV